MRTSNKILLGVFAAIILLLTGLHAALRVQYERGDIVVLDQQGVPAAMEKQTYGNVRHVVIRGLNECTIRPDSIAWAGINEQTKSELNIRKSADTLYIDGKLSEKEYEEGRRSHRDFVLQLPGKVSVTARYANITLLPSMDPALADTREIVLDRSQLYVLTQQGRDGYMKQLLVTARRSTILFTRRCVIGDLQLRMTDHCTMVDENAAFGRFSLHMDSTSSANLHGRNLEKMSIISE